MKAAILSQLEGSRLIFHALLDSLSDADLQKESRNPPDNFIQGSYTSAKEDLTKAIELQPDDGYNNYWRGLTFRLANDEPTAQTDFAQAITIVSNALATDTSPETAFRMSLYQLAAGNTDVAQQGYTDALNRPASMADIHDALDSLDRYLTYFPTNTPAQTIRQQLLDQHKGQTP